MLARLYQADSYRNHLDLLAEDHDIRFVRGVIYKHALAICVSMSIFILAFWFLYLSSKNLFIDFRVFNDPINLLLLICPGVVSAVVTIRTLFQV